jgi:hypothetical protein
MNKSGLLCLVLLLNCGGLLASGEAYVMSLPYAISEENIYKVRIEKIDDRVQSPRTRYPLNIGSHVVTVSLMLVVDWSPKIEGAGETLIQKQITLDVEYGMTYQIGARVDIDAEAESQLDGSFWEPFIYKSFEN